MKARLGAGLGPHLRAVLTVVLVLVTLGASGSPGEVELTLREGTNFAVALAPDGSRLALDLQGTLWTLPAAGGVATALTDGLGDDRLPDWSPDGKRLAFQSFRSGSWDIWAISADGEGLGPLTSGRDDDREPVWSPDGRRVLFSSDRAGSYDIWLLEVPSGETTALTHGPGQEFMPAWSPDGRAIVFLSRSPEGALELRKMTVLDRKEEKVVSLEGEAASPAVSPDGKSVVLTVLDARTSDLLRVPLGSGEPTRLTRMRDVFPFRPAWTKTGEILFTADGKIQRWASTDDIQTVDFSATVRLDRTPYRRRRVQFNEEEKEIPVRGIVRPVLSPDGRQIAFSALGDLWIAPVTGGEPKPLTRDVFLDSDPYWSPDGKQIVFSSDRLGTMDLWIVPVGETPARSARRLTSLPGAEVGPAWSPDGSQVAFLDEQGDVHSVSAGGGEPQKLRHVAGGASLPSWSADSRHLAVSVREANSSRFREGANRVLIMSLEGGASELLEEPRRSIGTRDGDGPVWSPDGRALAVATEGGLALLPVTAAGRGAGPARPVLDEPADFPSWSSDSKSLLYIASDKLKILDVESGATREVSLKLSYRTAAKSGRLVLKGARLIDGTGAPARENVDISIDAGRIESIEPTGGTIPADARIIDVTGQTVIPGLIEMHTHFSLPAAGSRHGRIWLSYGITSLRTPAASPYRVLEEREAIESGVRVGPRVFFTGYTFDGDRIYYNGSLALDDEPELRREMDRALRLDYDLIKTYVRLPDALQKAVIAAAHREGRFVTSHEIYPAVALGVDGIEHVRGTSRRGFSPKVSELRRSYQDVIDLVSRSGVYFTPTILIQGGFGLALAREPDLLDDPRISPLFPAWLLAGARATPTGPPAEREEIMKPLFKTVAAVARGGGRVIAGTDSPIVPYGLSLILEIEQYSEAGLGPLEAIRAATQVAAEALGAGKDLGTVEPGKLADLVILDGNPAEDIRNLRRTARVVVGGREISRERLLQLPWWEQPR